MKFLLSLSLLPLILFSQDNVSNAELSRKLDLILGKLGGLEERVTKLETDNVEVKKEVKEVAKSAKEAKTATENLSIPNDEKEKRSFLRDLRMKFPHRKRKTQVPGPKKNHGIKFGETLPVLKYEKFWEILIK